MINQKAFAHIAAVVTISLVAVTMIGAMLYFKSEADKLPATQLPVTNTNVATNTTVDTNTAVNTNATVADSAIWPRYTSDLLGFSFLYPSDTEVKWFPEASLAGAVRVVSKANPNKDSALYNDAAGPGSIGIVSYHFAGDLLEFATSMAGGLTPEPLTMLGVDAYRVQGTHDVNQTRVLGALESTVDYYFFNYNAATWGIEFDAKSEFADQTPSHDQFLQLVESFDFTVPDRGIWPTHENATHGFTFDYPPDWQVTDCGTEFTAVHMNSEAAPTCFADGITRVAIKVFPGETTTSSIIDGMSQMLNITERTATTVYGQPATKVVGTYKADVEGPAAPAGTEASFIFFDFGTNRYEMLYHGLDDISSLSTFTKIVNSVLFY